MNSAFTNIKAWADGAFALVNIDQIKMKIFNTNFESIFGGETTNFGGVIMAKSIGALTLETVTCSDVLVG
jgi:acyl-CoA thioesterase